MSQLVTEAQVQQYRANVFHLSQQKGSRLRSLVRHESQKGKTQFFDRIGAVTAQKKVGRHSNTPQMDTPHSRRACTLSDYEWADLVDVQDKLRMLQDPASDYSMAAMWALGRTMDDEIIAAADGNAMTGEKGDIAIAHPNSQKVAAINGGALSNLNVDTLRLMNKLFDDADVDPDEPRFIAVTSSQIYALLGQTAITSADYNNVKALVEGKVDTFMGFKFVRTQRLLKQSGSLSADLTTGAVGSGAGDVNGGRRVIAWAKNGLLHSVAQDMTARVSERDDKSYATQVYASLSNGAVRMEEEKVVVAFCKES